MTIWEDRAAVLWDQCPSPVADRARLGRLYRLGFHRGICALFVFELVAAAVCAAFCLLAEATR